MRLAGLSFCAAVVLGACATSPATIPTGNVGPGPKVMSAFDAGVIFADTCLIRGPNFETATEGLRVHNVTQHVTTGTYYHNSANLSVRVTPQQCSLVFGTDAPSDTVIAGLAQGTASIIPTPPSGIDITSRPAGDGLRYFRIAMQGAS